MSGSSNSVLSYSSGKGGKKKGSIGGLTDSDESILDIPSDSVSISSSSSGHVRKRPRRTPLGELKNHSRIPAKSKISSDSSFSDEYKTDAKNKKHSSPELSGQENSIISKYSTSTSRNESESPIELHSVSSLRKFMEEEDNSQSISDDFDEAQIPNIPNALKESGRVTPTLSEYLPNTVSALDTGFIDLDLGSTIPNNNSVDGINVDEEFEPISRIALHEPGKQEISGIFSGFAEDLNIDHSNSKQSTKDSSSMVSGMEISDQLSNSIRQPSEARRSPRSSNPSSIISDNVNNSNNSSGRVNLSAYSAANYAPSSGTKLRRKNSAVDEADEIISASFSTTSTNYSKPNSMDMTDGQYDDDFINSVIASHLSSISKKKEKKASPVTPPLNKSSDHSEPEQPKASKKLSKSNKLKRNDEVAQMFIAHGGVSAHTVQLDQLPDDFIESVISAHVSSTSSDTRGEKRLGKKIEEEVEPDFGPTSPRKLSKLKKGQEPPTMNDIFSSDFENDISQAINETPKSFLEEKAPSKQDALEDIFSDDSIQDEKQSSKHDSIKEINNKEEESKSEKESIKSNSTDDFIDAISASIGKDSEKFEDDFGSFGSDSFIEDNNEEKDKEEIESFGSNSFIEDPTDIKSSFIEMPKEESINTDDIISQSFSNEVSSKREEHSKSIGESYIKSEIQSSFIEMPKEESINTDDIISQSFSNEVSSRREDQSNIGDDQSNIIVDFMSDKEDGLINDVLSDIGDSDHEKEIKQVVEAESFHSGSFVDEPEDDNQTQSDSESLLDQLISKVSDDTGQVVDSFGDESFLEEPEVNNEQEAGQQIAALSDSPKFVEEFGSESFVNDEHVKETEVKDFDSDNEIDGVFSDQSIKETKEKEKKETKDNQASSFISDFNDDENEVDSDFGSGSFIDELSTISIQKKKDKIDVEDFDSDNFIDAIASQLDEEESNKDDNVETFEDNDFIEPDSTQISNKSEIISSFVSETNDAPEVDTFESNEFIEESQSIKKEEQDNVETFESSFVDKKPKKKEVESFNSNEFIEAFSDQSINEDHHEEDREQNNVEAFESSIESQGSKEEQEIDSDNFIDAISIELKEDQEIESFKSSEFIEDDKPTKKSKHSIETFGSDEFIEPATNDNSIAQSSIKTQDNVETFESSEFIDEPISKSKSRDKKKNASADGSIISEFIDNFLDESIVKEEEEKEDFGSSEFIEPITEESKVQTAQNSVDTFNSSYIDTFTEEASNKEAPKVPKKKANKDENVETFESSEFIESVSEIKTEGKQKKAKKNESVEVFSSSEFIEPVEEVSKGKKKETKKKENKDETVETFESSEFIESVSETVTKKKSKKSDSIEVFSSSEFIEPVKDMKHKTQKQEKETKDDNVETFESSEFIESVSEIISTKKPIQQQKKDETVETFETSDFIESVSEIKTQKKTTKKQNKGESVEVFSSSEFIEPVEEISKEKKQKAQKKASKDDNVETFESSEFIESVSEKISKEKPAQRKKQQKKEESVEVFSSSEFIEPTEEDSSKIERKKSKKASKSFNSSEFIETFTEEPNVEVLDSTEVTEPLIEEAKKPKQKRKKKSSSETSKSERSKSGETFISEFIEPTSSEHKKKKEESDLIEVISIESPRRKKEVESFGSSEFIEPTSEEKPQKSKKSESDVVEVLSGSLVESFSSDKHSHIPQKKKRIHHTEESSYSSSSTHEPSKIHKKKQVRLSTRFEEESASDIRLKKRHSRKPKPKQLDLVRNQSHISSDFIQPLPDEFTIPMQKFPSKDKEDFIELEEQIEHRIKKLSSPTKLKIDRNLDVLNFAPEKPKTAKRRRHYHKPVPELGRQAKCASNRKGLQLMSSQERNVNYIDFLETQKMKITHIQKQSNSSRQMKALRQSQVKKFEYTEADMNNMDEFDTVLNLRSPKF